MESPHYPTNTFKFLCVILLRRSRFNSVSFPMTSVLKTFYSASKKQKQQKNTKPKSLFLLLFLSQHICWFLMKTLYLPRVLFQFSLSCGCVILPLLFICIYWGLFHIFITLKVSVIKATMYLCPGALCWGKIVTDFKTGENVIHLEHGHLVTSIRFSFQVLNGLSDSKGFGTSPKLK